MITPAVPPRTTSRIPSRLAAVVAALAALALVAGVPLASAGSRTGSDLLGVGAPGLHLHGLTKARDAGGHILGSTTGPDVRLSIQRTLGVRILAGP